MGLLVDGVWHDRWYDTESTGGRFVREATRFHGQVTADGASGFAAEAGRYHLYVSYACPWAHRALIVRALEGLERAISVSVVDPRMGSQGWVFGDFPGATDDPVNGATRLSEIYVRARPDYTGRVTVPVLWDRETGTIVNNESAELIEMLDGAFSHLARTGVELSPPGLRDAIDEVNALVYDSVNNGVYRAGFATTQQAYDEAVGQLFDALDRLEQRLSTQRYLCGERLTLADIRLFTTLVRFDPVYHGHFKCNRRALREYPALWGFTRELYQLPGVAPTVRMDHIKTHYYWSHTGINPTRIVPAGPDLDLTAPHGRDHLPGRPLERAGG